MKTHHPAIDTYSFWKGNRKDGFFQLSAEEVIEKYKEWLPTENLDWHTYYGLTDSINRFVSKYLLSIGNTENDFEEYRSMELLLRDVRNNYLQKATEKSN